MKKKYIWLCLFLAVAAFAATTRILRKKGKYIRAGIWDEEG